LPHAKAPAAAGPSLAQLAFVAFLVAVNFFTLASFLEPTFHNGAAAGYLGFALLLAG
jgi:hypothetical protein